MILYVIGSSSRGNSYLLSSPKSTLILECGVRFSEIKKALNYDLSPVCACLITHEHGDHSKSANDVAAAGIDIYSSPGTLEALKLSGHRFHPVQAKKRFTVGEFSIMPFDVKHDCQEPFGFLIQHPESGTILFATDTYYIPYNFPGLNQIIVEVNYDEEILDGNVFKGRVPEAVKNRVLRSHMELSTFKHFLSITDISAVHNIVMIHLSDGNSDEKKFVSEIIAATGKTTQAARPGMTINLSKTPF
jgi:phosphoribosyl 1,2-cyclic phosphodiesterase